MRSPILYVVLGLALLGGAFYAYQYSSGSCDVATASEECQSPVAIYEDPSRLPLRDFVLSEIGSLAGRTVLDIGAGPGYFAFEMAKTAERVIATELDDQFLQYMKEKKKNLRADNFEIIQAREDYSEIESLSNVDVVLLVYVFHYLEQPRLFLEKLKKVLSENGQVFIANSQYAPQVIKDYLEGAGFAEITQVDFVHAQPGCGPVDVQLISAQLATDLANTQN